MRTIVWAILGACALGLHEYLVVRPGARPVRTALVRWAALAALIAAAVFSAPRVLSRIAPLLEAPASSSRFDPAGDPLRLRALIEQRPERPFPSGGDGAAVGAWQHHVIAELRGQMDLALEGGETVSGRSFETVGVQMVGTIRRTLIRFTSWDGTRVPGYVLDPGGNSAKGAVLVVPGHGRGIEATAGLADDYQHHAALELAKRGYVAMTVELRGFGMLSPVGAPSHRLVAAAALSAGSSYKAVVARDLSRALTILSSWQGVNPARLAVTGTSLGGELAILLSALDPRVRVAVSNSYGGTVGPALEDDDLNDESGQTPHGCHTMPGINRILLHEDWFRLLAPRPALIVRGDGNASAGAGGFERLVKEAYEAKGAAEKFELRVEPGGHEFYIEPTVRFIDSLDVRVFRLPGARLAGRRRLAAAPRPPARPQRTAPST